MSTKNAIVTGGAGFIGSHVTDLLVERGYNVHIVDDFTTGFRQYVHPDATLHEMDIRSKELISLFEEIKPVAVVHLAAHVDLRSSYEEPGIDSEINIGGSLNVLDATTAGGAKGIVFASSAAVYSPAIKTNPITEDMPCEPGSPYGIAKYAFELYLRVLAGRRGLAATALRFGNVYGPRQTIKGESGVISIFTQKLIQGEAPRVNGTGEQTRDFVFVKDIARMIVEGVEKHPDGAFNVGTGAETSVKDLYDAVASAVGTELEPEYGPAKPGDERNVSLDPSKAEQEIGFRPGVLLAEGIPETITWAKKMIEAGEPVR